MIASTMPKRSAHQKLSTVNPGTITPASITSRPLITKIKSPIVKIVMGRVKNMSIGRKIKFIAPSTTARTKAETRPLTCTPGKT